MLYALILLSAIKIIYGFPTKTSPNENEISARQAEGPWTVLLKFKIGYRCTGSLVQEKYVITAAHCFDLLVDYESLREEIKIYFGEWKTDMDPDCENGDYNYYSEEDVCYPDYAADIPPKKLTIHPEYLKKRGTLKKNSFDIAIIELMRPPRKTKITQSIALPNKSTCDDDIQGSLLVTGFGEIKPKEYTTIKKKINISLKDQSDCKRKLGSRFNTEYHFCGIGPNSRATCTGDSGGPAANVVNEKYTLQGIVSFGSSECGHGNTPSGFLKVACFVEWIQTIIGNKNIKTSRKTTTAEPTQSSDEY